MISDQLITTNLELPGYRITGSLGIVRGITVRSRSVIGNALGMMRITFGGNITGFETLCDTAREHAFRKMIRHAEDLGADAIIGFRYDATELMPQLTEVLAYGTACRIEKL